jgi:hypothetical protein
VQKKTRGERRVWGRGARGRKRAGRSGETQETLRGSLARETLKFFGARLCVMNGKMKWFHHSDLSSCGCRAQRAGYGRPRPRMFVFATCSLQFAKASSAAKQSQQEKNNSAELQRGI